MVCKNFPLVLSCQNILPNESYIGFVGTVMAVLNHRANLVYMNWGSFIWFEVKPLHYGYFTTSRLSSTSKCWLLVKNRLCQTMNMAKGVLFAGTEIDLQGLSGYAEVQCSDFSCLTAMYSPCGFSCVAFTFDHFIV